MREHIAQSQKILKSAKEKVLSISERVVKSIELAEILLRLSLDLQTSEEKERQQFIAGLISDPSAKIFIIKLTDECFRSNDPLRTADQLLYLIEKYGIPKHFKFQERAGLKIFKWLGRRFPKLLVPLAKKLIRKQTSSVIAPGNRSALNGYIEKRNEEGIRINLNHLGEAILGEEEAEKRLKVYLEDLSNPNITYISVKISTICSQLNLLAYDETAAILTKRLITLFKAAMEHTPHKFVNLDMEEYRDLHLTIDSFCKALEDPSLKNYSAGIVLQAYLPDGFPLQEMLTHWSINRVSQGGAPIKIRIVKGANLAMEKVDASLHGWPQAPYLTKTDVDANFKKMVVYGSHPAHAQVVNLGIGSHNLFDIAFALIVRAENKIEPFMTFEMLEGMTPSMSKAVQLIAGDMLLYCPTATEREFQNAIAYLIRRLDENTADENFLRHTFNLRPGSREWREQAERFKQSYERIQSLSNLPRRTQNRLHETPYFSENFENIPETDWSQPINQRWAEKIVQEWSSKDLSTIPLSIGDAKVESGKIESAENPSYPDKPAYKYSKAQFVHIDQALTIAKGFESIWDQIGVSKRSEILAHAAFIMQQRRGDLIGAMAFDTGKIVSEGDVEVCEAIDFIEYYRRNAEEYHYLSDLKFRPKGTILVTPPWNFPCSIPTGGIAAALAAGNCVIFKPAPESVLAGWEIAKCFWDGGIPKEALQFLPCDDDPEGSALVKDPRISAIVLTGSTSTAKLFYKMRPGLDLIAETGGKNALIVSNLADRDLAVKDLIQSAFGHSGQKCSACSLAILHAELYDDPHFLETLRDAAKSLKVSVPYDLGSKINPLIREPNPALYRGLTELEQGESWLLKPIQDSHNPNLWSPGIKIGVQEGSFTHQTELFGPVLGVMRADTLDDAIRLANGTPYGLTSGIHTLDEREQMQWIGTIEAGNCYVNRTITGAIVRRQPFGGIKASSFGKGMKAGGPNYISQFMHASQAELPRERFKPGEAIQNLLKHIEFKLNGEQKHLWEVSIENYFFYWKAYFSLDHDPAKILGQDNILRYVPHSKMFLRVENEYSLLDAFRVIAAAQICGTPLDISCNPQLEKYFANIHLPVSVEEESTFISRIDHASHPRVRLVSPPSEPLKKFFAERGVTVILDQVLANGRIELLNYLREASVSITYHRYGNLGEREYASSCCTQMCSTCPCCE